MSGAIALALSACASDNRMAMLAQGAGYSPGQIETASRAACQAYGILPYTERYERCVRNEYASRSAG